MSSWNGTYLGFSFTDESPTLLAELELVITDERVTIRFATGYSVETPIDESRSNFREMRPAEIAAHVTDNSILTGMCGLAHLESGLRLLRLPYMEEVKEAARLIIVGLTEHEPYGPTLAFLPDQVAAGYFERTIRAVEAEYGAQNVIPRLANGGELA